MNLRSVTLTFILILTAVFPAVAQPQKSCVSLFEVHPVPSIGLTPQNIRKPLEVAAFLAWVKKYIPDMYQNTKDFPVNFWEAVHERNTLEDLLREFPVYRKYLEQKKTLVKMRIQSEKPRSYLFATEKFREQIEFDGLKNISLEKANQILERSVSEKGTGASNDLLTDLMYKVDGPDRKEVSKNLQIDLLLGYFEKKGEIPESFRGKNYDLTPPWDLQKIKDRYRELTQAEARIARLKRWIFFKTNESALTDDAAAADLALGVTDKNLKALLEPYLIKVDSSEPPVLSGVDLTVQEVPDALAMFKSCVGIECTPPRFASLPSERAFFIYDSQDLSSPKGYLSAAEIVAKDGRKILYLKQFQGPHLNATTAEAILWAAGRLAEAMGCEEAVIAGAPHSNYSILSLPWQSFVDRSGGLFEFNFTDASIRELIDVEPKDKGQSHHSEGMAHISEVYPMQLPAKLAQARMKISIEQEMIPLHPLAPLSAIDRIEAGIAYARFMEGKPQGEKANVFFQLGLNQSDMQALVQVLKNPTLYTKSEFEQKLIQHAQTQDQALTADEILKHLRYLLQANQMRFKDSFSTQHEAENVTALIQKVKSLRMQADWVFRDLVHLNGHAVPLLKARILELARNATDPDKMKIVSWLVYLLKAEHLSADFVSPLLEAVQKNMIFMNQNLLETPKKISNNNTNSGYFRIMTALYPLHSKMVLAQALALQAPWKLDYYIQLPVALRAQVPAFRDSLLWNLKEVGQDGNRWYLKNQLSITELATLLDGQYTKVDGFSDQAITQLLEKLLETCRGAGNQACGPFLDSYPTIEKANTAEDFISQARELVKNTLMSWGK